MWIPTGAYHCAMIFPSMRRSLAVASSLALVVGLGVFSVPAQGAGTPRPVIITKAEAPLFEKLWASGRTPVAPALTVGPEVGWNAGLQGLTPPRASYYRLWDMNVAWRDVNPAPGVFDWSILERRIALVESWGGKPLMVLGLTPQWAARDKAAGDPRWGAGTASPPADINSWRSYVRALVQQFGSRIGAYEIWNEANLQTFWTGTPAEMAQMVDVAVEEIGSTALAIAPSVTTRLRSGADFTTAMIPALAPATIDGLHAWNIHSYPAGDAGPSWQDACKQRVDDIVRWQKALVALAANNPKLIKPTWDTEVNYGLAGPGARPGRQWTGLDAPSLVTCTYQDSSSLGIPVTFWYEFTADVYPLLGVQMTPPRGSEGVRTVVAFEVVGQSPPVVNQWIPQLNQAVTPRISITGERIKIGSSSGVKVQGSVTGVEVGTVFHPWFRLPGQTSYTKGIAVVRVEDGGKLSWQRKFAKRVSVYLESQDGRVKSNTVTIASA
jgi:hypothetical protein